jgi:hypothetical protein
MTVDIRAKIMCDLGEVISGGWSDDHAQGTGLIRTRGEIILKGLVRPTLGQKVRLAYVQKGYASRFPRSFRVLSAFADPYRRQTTIQLGCALTLRENLRGKTPEENTAATWDDPVNAEIECSKFAQGTISITAGFVASKCLRYLDLTSDNIPLTNLYTVEEFDLSSGYVNVLSDLLVSESYLGYLDANEILRIRSLSSFTGTVTVVNQSQVIDVKSINSGSIPGDSVAATYTYNRFKKPEDDLTEEEKKRRDWERDETVGPPAIRRIEWSGGTYVRKEVPKTVVTSVYDRFDRLVKRTTKTTTSVAATNPSYIKWYLESREVVIDGDDVSITVHTPKYQYPAEFLTEPVEPPPPGSCDVLYRRSEFDPSRDRIVVSETTETYVSEMAIAGALDIMYSGLLSTGVNWGFRPSLNVVVLAERVVTTFETDAESGITKSISTQEVAQAFAPQGNQVAAAESETTTGPRYAGQVIDNASVLLNLGSTVHIRTDREYGLQLRPSRSERNNNATRKDVVESASDIVFVFGGESSGSITLYNVPYVSDDRIFVVAGGNFVVFPSDAPVKAARFARAQNTLAFGYRNGFSVQLAAPDVPPYPLDRFRIQGAGAAAAYVTNGTSWAFDSNGIICNTDALFVGGVGTTEVGGSLWFPVQPGITLIGPAPAVYDNPYPEPANSYPVEEEFDPVDPPENFWDELLPTDTPAIPAQETVITQLVPAWREEISYVFSVRTTIDVERGFINIPTIQTVTLVVRTKISVFELSVRNITLRSRTVLALDRGAVAIREDLTECFTITGLTIVPFVVTSS